MFLAGVPEKGLPSEETTIEPACGKFLPESRSPSHDVGDPNSVGDVGAFKSAMMSAHVVYVEEAD